MNVVCTKCGSPNIRKILANQPKPPKEKVYTMDEVARGEVPAQNNITLAVMTYTTYKFICDNCGYKTKPFTQSDQLGTVKQTFAPVSTGVIQVNPKSHTYADSKGNNLRSLDPKGKKKL